MPNQLPESILINNEWNGIQTEDIQFNSLNSLINNQIDRHWFIGINNYYNSKLIEQLADNISKIVKLN